MEKKQNKTPKFANLLRSHRKEAVLSLQRMTDQPWSTLSTLFVIATALLLPACLLVLNSSLDSAVDSFRSTARVTLYLEASISDAQAQAVSDRLLARDDVVGVEYISAAQALQEFSAATGLRTVLAGLGENPLPASIVLQPSAADSSLVGELARYAASLSEVDSVQADESWIQRAEAIASTLGFLGQSLGLIFALGVSFIVGNAVRMTVESRRAEIKVIKLVGGSDSFIARPLLYTGLWYGLLGALLAAIVLSILVYAANAALQGQSVDLLPGLTLSGPGVNGYFSLLLAGAVLGWVAARVASWHYIRAINL
jgi:cell division transport system permease protein